MSTYKTLRSEWIIARKEKASTATFMSTLIGEMGTLAKNAGRAEPTEEEVQKVLKKFHKGLVESIKISPSPQLSAELVLVESFMPTVMTENDLRNYMRINCQGMNMGQIMGHLKQNLGASVDMKMASQIAKEM